MLSQNTIKGSQGIHANPSIKFFFSLTLILGTHEMV